MLLLEGNNTFATQLMKNPLMYNNQLAMASTITEREPRPAGAHHTGIPIVKINGMTSHHASDLIPPPGKKAAFGQVYTLNQEAADLAREANPYAQQLHMETLKFMDRELRKVNHFTERYRTAHTLMEEAREQAEREGRTITSLQIRIMDRQQAADVGIAEPNRQQPITQMVTPTVDQVSLPESLSLGLILLRIGSRSFRGLRRSSAASSTESSCHLHRTTGPHQGDGVLGSPSLSHELPTARFRWS